MSLFTDLLPIISVLVVAITSIGLLLSHNWRIIIALIAIQYAGVALLTSSSWPMELSIAKMVAGWMAGAVLGVAAANTPSEWKSEKRHWPSGIIFRLLAALMVLITVLSGVSKVGEMFPQLTINTLSGGLILISMGLLHLGMTAHPLRISIGLLTLLAGFEVIYAAVESSTLVTGLLAGVNLGLGLVGAYLITAQEMEPEIE